jgi:hypothetical protein
MTNFAAYNWTPAHAPVNVVFVQPTTFTGSGFPFEKMDHAFATESGPTWGTGPQNTGKRIVEFGVDNLGAITSGPTTLIEYTGTGKATAVGLAAGPDGLYFSDLYKDSNYVTPIDAGAQILRIRYLGAGGTAAPVISPSGGSFAGPVTVTMSSTTPGASIRYTIDGSMPSITNGTYYTGPFTLTVSAPVQAIAYTASTQTSSVTPASFTIAGSGPGIGLKAEYFADTELTSIKMIRTDATVDFNWAELGPDPLVGPNNWSARWTGQIQPQFSQTYTFTTTTDDGVRLWVNGVQLINDWNGHPPTNNSGSIALTGGQLYDIKMEYFDGGADAIARLFWSSPSQPQQIIPQNRLFPPSSGTPAVAPPVFTPNGGTFASPQSVGISTVTPGASIYYTTDGSTPTSSSTLYTTPFTVSANATAKAIAKKAGMTDSAITSATFNVGPTVATPTITPNGGTHVTSVQVTLATTTGGAAIRYTTDGSTPNSSSPAIRPSTRSASPPA